MRDSIPVIGCSAVAENAYNAFGFSAHGFQLGPIVGRVLPTLWSTAPRRSTYPNSIFDASLAQWRADPARKSEATWYPDSVTKDEDEVRPVTLMTGAGAGISVRPAVCGSRHAVVPFGLDEDELAARAGATEKENGSCRGCRSMPPTIPNAIGYSPTRHGDAAGSAYGIGCLPRRHDGPPNAGILPQEQGKGVR